MYRFIQYKNGFNQKKSLGGARSVVGAYMIRVGLEQYYWWSWVATRVINLVGDEQFENDLMNIVRDDIANGVSN